MLKALGSGVAEMEREQTVSAQVWGARRAEDLPSTIPYWRLYPRMVRVPRQRRFMNIKRTKVSDGDASKPSDVQIGRTSAILVSYTAQMLSFVSLLTNPPTYNLC
jgi:hypothetical protein